MVWISAVGGASSTSDSCSN